MCTGLDKNTCARWIGPTVFQGLSDDTASHLKVGSIVPRRYSEAPIPFNGSSNNEGLRLGFQQQPRTNTSGDLD